MSTAPPEHPALPVGATLDRGFALLRRHPRALLLPQLVLNLIPALFGLLLVAVGALLLGDVETTTKVVRESTFLGDSTLTTQEVADYSGGQQALLAVLGALGGVVFAWFLIAAGVSVVRGADRALDGREHLPLGAAMRGALTATPKLFGLAVLFWLLLVAVLAVLALLVAGVAQVAGGLALLAGLAALAAFVFVGVRLVLWPVAHLSEDTGLGAFRRAWDLSRGRFWALLALLLLVAIVVSVASLLLNVVLQLGVLGLFALDGTVGAVAAIPVLLASVVVSMVATAGFIAPIVAAYRTLAGRDAPATASPVVAASGGLATPGPPVAPGTRRWDATEEPLWASGRGRGEAAQEDAPGPAGPRDADPRDEPPRR